ncbi:MAG: hypothetical protein KIT31_24145 [Deltaproteobacteria bacterium]|nr:hypothetical protein [Deltaproteobacteria bacterium]
MKLSVLALVLALVLAACGEGAPATAPQKGPTDAAVADADPAAGAGEVARPPWPKGAARARPIEVLLKSSPPGAFAYVDGYALGKTPTYWPGDHDGQEHVFEFALKGHATARYRFIPVTNGVVHGRLEPLSEGVRDAGVPMAPVFLPDAAVAPDAAPRVEYRPPPRPIAPDAAEAAPEPPAEPPAGSTESKARPGGAGPEP